MVLGFGTLNLKSSESKFRQLTVLGMPESSGQETQQFAHFTTYPMALSPHFARPGTARGSTDNLTIIA